MKEKTKKSFFFEDYTESEILFSNKKFNIRILRNRINFLFFIFISLAFIFSIKIFHLSLYPAKDFSTKSNRIKKHQSSKQSKSQKVKNFKTIQKIQKHRSRTVKSPKKYEDDICLNCSA